ncbi:conserved hypothetical protein [Desulfamplus magnetovallimortis]|uniref:Zinc finger/thioredoxin putative domain-containing protein n=1 Tax=Desulfamplus magnetovallimortis TaxID=1246637 RepID=A0A1W1H4Y5_9BACT|nr:zinc-ribbon domain-containing protein [Desulfamplus magnetovallimortis]SLM27539.1 conserved hypothetical protein [Desulfamplus magnetovallimortis]
MEISCNHCYTKLNIPDEKIPKGRKASLLCPKCKQRIHIMPDESNTQTLDSSEIPVQSKAPQVPVPRRVYPETSEYNASDKPFDLLDENAKTALLCISHPHALEISVKIMNSMQYQIETVDNVQTALNRMKYHLFNIIIVDEDFDVNRRGFAYLMEYINDLDMMLRRRTVVFFLSKNHRTMDNMASFHLSVNQIINISKITGMEGLVRRTVKEHEQFYAIYNESLRKMGKIT